MSRDKGFGGRSKRRHIGTSVMQDREHAGLTDGIHSDGVNGTDDAIGGSPNSTATLTPEQEGGRGQQAAGGSLSSSRQDILEYDQIASNPFVVNLMDRLAALENSLTSKSAKLETVTANQTGRLTGSKPQLPASQVLLTGAQEHAAQPTEAGDVLEEGCEAQNLQDMDATDSRAHDKQTEIQSTLQEKSPALKNSRELRKRVKRI